MQVEYLIHGAYFGVMLALLIIALIFATLMKQMLYVHYALFLASSTLMWGMLNGFEYQYLWPQSVYWHNEGFHIVFLLVPITALQFSKGFLKINQYSPRVHRILTSLQLLMLAGIALRFLGLYEPVLYLSFSALSILMLLPLLGLLAYGQGLRYARWYTLAWVIYALGLVLSVLSASSDVFSWGMQALAYAQVGSLLEAMLLLLALGERLTGWDRDRLSALEMANHDALTGLGNRRLLAQALENVRDRFIRTGMPVFLLLIDLDHFKDINDTYGHEAGDQVLREMAHLLTGISRPDDVCVRYGGEEFAVLFQAPSMSAALAVTERIRTKFEEEPTIYKGQHIHHTLSAGLSQLPAEKKNLSTDQSIGQADMALYWAKKAGRNQTAAFDPDHAQTQEIVPGHRL